MPVRPGKHGLVMTWTESQVSLTHTHTHTHTHTYAHTQTHTKRHCKQHNKTTTTNTHTHHHTHTHTHKHKSTVDGFCGNIRAICATQCQPFTQRSPRPSDLAGG